MKSSKRVVIGILSLAVIASVSALSVNIDEIRSTSSEVIQFESYSGPHALVESADAITQIGRNLGRQVASNVNNGATYGANTKYTVIHAVDSTGKNKLDADILVINENATVDHITNLRRIITGYLVSAYGYEESDASTIATFITVYNAVYRQNLDVYKAKYKTTVTKNLTSDKCGLSTKWSDWPGSSQIVIPLFDVNGGLSTVDTSVISDSNVIKSMREEDNLGVDERQNMVDIKEREAGNFAEKAQAAAENAAEQNKRLEEQQKVSAQAQQDANKAQQAAQQAAAQAKSNPDDKTLQQRAEVTQQAAEQAKQTAEDEKKKTEQQRQKTQQAEQAANQAQSNADKKLSEAARERTEIAKDQQKILMQALADASDRNAVVGLKLIDADNDLTGLVRIDSTSGEIISESPVRVIRGRTIIPVTVEEEGNATSEITVAFMAICGETTGNNSAVKLCLLDAQTLELTAESKEAVSEKSVLVRDGQDYYCVIQSGSGWVVGKYDKNLKLLLKSPVQVRKDTPITVTSKGVVVTTSADKVVLLDLKDLSSITTIK